MKALESWAILYLLNSVWQIPLVSAAAWIAARIARPTGPQLEHRIWVGALFLEIVLPGWRINCAGILQQLLSIFPSRGIAPVGQVRVVIAPGITTGESLLRLSPNQLSILSFAYAATLLYFAARVAWGLRQTYVLKRDSQPLRGLNGYESIAYSTQIAVSPGIGSPVTIGLTRSLLLLPPTFIEQVNGNDLDAALAHEFAHIQRYDFAKNLTYCLLSLPIAYHPLLWLTRSRLAETREMVCDAIAAEAVQGRDRYARSLLRLATMLSGHVPTRTLHAIGIFDANIFERRIMHLTQKRIKVPAAQRIAIVAACSVVALTTCVSALALRMNNISPTASQSDAPKSIHVNYADMKIVTKVQPQYPADAKAAGVQGEVVLKAVIGKEGVPEQLSVEKGPKELQKSALDAVRQWRWQPYLLNGEPVEVDTNITVIYSLAK
jgi:TonB family protein